MKRDARIFVAGADTLAGAALMELLPERGFTHVFQSGPLLNDSYEVEAYFAHARPEYVFLVGGMSGGIALNRARPAELMLDNLQIIANVIDAAHRYGVAKLLYLASACAYPGLAPQPMRIESLLSGPVESTSQAYATAKLAGWKLCEACRQQYGSRFITAFPANPFGPHDDFGPESGHVIPALIRRMTEAKRRGDDELVIWGSGTPQREFIYARDLADACLFAMRQYDEDAPINLGGGEIVSIAEAARTIADVVGYRGRLTFDEAKPDGAPLKALDSSALKAMGWRPTMGFRAGVAKTYEWFVASESQIATVDTRNESPIETNRHRPILATAAAFLS
jgi:GDP-L-fucose synthase